MKTVSLDPRFNRIQLPDGPQPEGTLSQFEHWQTYEVFVQKKRGQQHQHVGIVHAPNADMALVLSKEQFARRGVCANIWVVKTADVVATDYSDSDIFDSTPEKLHREAVIYKVKDKIEAYQAAKKEKI